jgi:TonB-linked SusC/RagA family outer membrane protein
MLVRAPSAPGVFWFSQRWRASLMRSKLFVGVGGALLALLLAVSEPVPVEAQQSGSVTGVVVDGDTGQPLSGVQVYVEGRSLGSLTQPTGRFLILNVPVGRHTVVAQMIGYGTQRVENLLVEAGGTAQANFNLRTQALSLEEIVVTGVTDPISGVKLPFTVSSVTKQALPVPTTSSAIGAIQGKVAGATIVRGSGQPGSGVSILLRTPTSIVRSNTPMFVVDGVILSSTIGGSTVDLESLDIEKIEVVKGAAAAALYGSRAAAGVVSITTSRGTGVAVDETRITARTEFGTSQLPQGVPLTSHHYFATDAQGRFIDDKGVPITSLDQSRVVAPDRMLDKAYGGTLYDNVDAFFRPGQFITNSVTLANRSERTNYLLAINNYDEKGIITTNDGYERYNLRLNLDHQPAEKLDLSISLYHNRSSRDELSGDPFWDVLMFTPDIDLTVKDADGNYIQQPDPLLIRENPIWRQTSRDNWGKRARTLINGTVRLEPFSWLNFEAVASYDRGDNTDQTYVPKGVVVVSSLDNEETLGQYLLEHRLTDTYNASFSANFMRRFGDLIARSTLRGIMERETYTRFTADSRNFWVKDVQSMDIGQDQRTSSFWQEIRANGYMAQTGLDYAGKYIGDFLIRRDGSSLFGPEARWQTYYRASGAWRMGQESWFSVPGVSEFKLRASLGTAGGRPSFSDQYETWTISSSGAISKGTLGNKNLEPEYTTEMELGLDVILWDRVQVELTRAYQKTEGQLIQIPQVAASGYSNQWQNAGAIEGTSYEATVQVLLAQQQNFNWSATLVADKTSSEITDWQRVCYFNELALRCIGSNLTRMYGDRFIRNASDLPAGTPGSEFQVNDDGYLVWVGSGGWQDGRWGESTTLEGVGYSWGHPILQRDSTGGIAQVPIGEGNSDLNLGLVNQVRWGNLTAHAHLQARIGGQVYNRTKQRLYQHFRHMDLDQTGKSPESKKPIDYYQTLYNTNNNTSHFVEDAGYLKVREVSLRYTFDRDALQSIGISRLPAERISLGLIGRNLLTFTGYSGYDPEVGSIFNPQDNFAWPNTRALTAFVEIQF